MRFVGEEAEAQAMPCAAILDARDLIKLVVIETGNVSSGGRHRCDRGAQVDDEQLAAAARVLRHERRLRARRLYVDFAGVVFHVSSPTSSPPGTPPARGGRNFGTDAFRRGRERAYARRARSRQFRCYLLWRNRCRLWSRPRGNPAVLGNESVRPEALRPRLSASLPMNLN
jgi:hypothetical protein